MNKRQIKSVVTKIEKSRLKIRKLNDEMTVLQNEAQKQLDDMARACCPYKKGQMFKQHGAVVYAKMTGFSATKMKYGQIREDYIKAPFVLDCLRCNIKGVTQPGKFIMIEGHEIGTKWDLIEP